MNGISRRRLLTLAGSAGFVAAVAPGTAMGRSTAMIRATGAHPANITNYVPQLVAISQGFVEDEGLDFQLIVSGGGSKLRAIVAAGEADFGLGDISHSLQMTTRGRPAKILMAIDQRAVISNIVVRRDLYDAGIDSVAKFVAWKRSDGGKPVLAVSTLGGGQHVYASYILSRLGAAGDVTWLAGGVTQTMLGGLMTGKFDAIVAPPSWQFEAEDRGWGKTVLDLRDEKSAVEIFGANVPATVFYALDETIADEPGKVQAYVNAMYRAMQWIKDGSAEEIYASVGEKYLNALPADMVKREIAYYKDIFSYDGRISAEVYGKGGNVWFGGMTGIAEIPFADAVDNRFVEAAQKKYGA
ncbi:MAG TPA: ABC transporter substrate-binding protein [Arenibaculum sp.]|nr:ABC transporter substrate-binding protein [Arenibaculum sp.]